MKNTKAYGRVELNQQTLVLRDCLIKVVVVQHQNAVILSILGKNKCTDKKESSKLHLVISA